MFPKKFRLPTNTRLQNPKIIYTPLFVLKLDKNRLLFNRYSFVVSKKVDKRATVRNKIKRQIRSVFEDLNKKIEQGNDFLMIIKKEALNKSRDQIYNETVQLLSKLGFLTK